MLAPLLFKAATLKKCYSLHTKPSNIFCLFSAASQISTEIVKASLPTFSLLAQRHLAEKTPEVV